MSTELPTFAHISWNREDVIFAEGWNASRPDAHADEFLRQHEKLIQDRLVVLGNEIIQDLLVSWEGPPPRSN